MSKKKRASYQDQMCDLFHDYVKEHGNEPVDLNDCYEWARKNGRWTKPQATLRAIFKREMAIALRSERSIDDDGTPIRKNHAFHVKEGQKQLHLWLPDIANAQPSHAKMSFQQRRLILAHAAVQHDRDVQHYNRMNPFGAQLKFDYDLNRHVEDARHPVEYPEERPPEA